MGSILRLQKFDNISEKLLCLSKKYFKVGLISSECHVFDPQWIMFRETEKFTLSCSYFPARCLAF